MDPRRLSSRFALIALLAAASTAAGAPLAENPVFTFFSSISEEPLARLEAESIGPHFVKHGPFEIPAPGVTIEAPALTLHDQPCTADDWARVLKELARFQHAPGCIQSLITLPDGNVFIFQRPPSAASGMLSGLVRPLNPGKGQTADVRLLRITHDGKDRLRIDLRALPSVTAQPAPPAPAKPEPGSAAPLPSVPPASSESVASP